MYTTNAIPAATARELRKFLGASEPRHLLDYVPGAVHFAASLGSCAVAVLSGVPVDPRGRLSRSWLRLVQFEGDAGAWDELVRATSESPHGEPLALWHLVGDSCVLVRTRPADPLQMLIAALQNTGAGRAPDTLSEPAALWKSRAAERAATEPARCRRR